MESEKESSFKEILERLLSFPFRGQIKIDFEIKKRVVRFSASIFNSPETLPLSVKEYIEARKGRIFRPYATSFILEGEKKIQLIQELPFEDAQPHLRERVQDFWELGKVCHRLLMEIALEEVYGAALHQSEDAT